GIKRMVQDPGAAVVDRSEQPSPVAALEQTHTELSPAHVLPQVGCEVNVEEVTAQLVSRATDAEPLANTAASPVGRDGVSGRELALDPARGLNPDDHAGDVLLEPRDGVREADVDAEPPRFLEQDRLEVLLGAAARAGRAQPRRLAPDPAGPDLSEEPVAA